jgi:hypothetical protein
VKVDRHFGERITSTVIVEQKAKQETSMKQTASEAYSPTLKMKAMLL